MSIILVTGILLIVVSLFTEKKYRPYIGFAFVFLIMGFQSNVQGDFMAYMDDFYKIQSLGVSNAPSSDREPFHPFLMKLFSWGPWWLFVAIISLFQTVVLTKFVNKYCEKKGQWLAAIIFFFTFNLMLLQMKAMRQGVAVELIVLAFLLIDKKEIRLPWPSLFLVYIAYLTHNTSLVALPFILFFWIVLKKPRLIEGIGNGVLFPWIVLVLFILIAVARETILIDYLVSYSMLLGVEDLTYLSYLDGSNQDEFIMNNMESMSLIYLLYFSILIFILSKYYQECNAKMRYLTFISIFSLFGEMVLWEIGTLPRIMMYFSVFHIIIFPNAYSFLQRKYGNIWAYGFIAMILLFTIKLSLPWMTLTKGGRFGTYEFVFW